MTTTATELQARLQSDTKLRSSIRRMAGKSGTSYPIEVVDDAAQPAPQLAGESWHYETRGGQRIHHPSAYSKRGFGNMIYRPSTHRIEIDYRWLLGYLAG